MPKHGGLPETVSVLLLFPLFIICLLFPERYTWILPSKFEVIKKTDKINVSKSFAWELICIGALWISDLLWKNIAIYKIIIISF
jgi:hypothetical protein